MKRHVVDGAHILRRTPEMPALAPIVAFEHHLRQDLSGYPENIGHRKLNLCTQIVSIADVFDALRSNRVYREGLRERPHRVDHGREGQPGVQPEAAAAVHQPDGAVSRSARWCGSTPRRSASSPHEHPTDPFRPQVKIVRDRDGARARRAAARQHLGARLAGHVPVRGRRGRGSRYHRAGSSDGVMKSRFPNPNSQGAWDPGHLNAAFGRVRLGSWALEVGGVIRMPTPAHTEHMSAQQSAALADFARTCKAAARSVSLYPATHPAIQGALGRVVNA